MPDLLPPTILAESWDIRLPLSLYPFKLLVPSVTTARVLLSVDALPPQPYITGILPIVPPPAWLAPDVHPRRFAAMPFPERPPPIAERDRQSKTYDQNKQDKSSDKDLSSDSSDSS
jgi:hypothetical protein